MTRSTARSLRALRLLSQVAFLIIFFVLLVIGSRLFFYFDPLLFLMNFLATGTVLKIFLLSLIPVGLTLVFGRFFCGWVCPLGTLHQFFTWLGIRARKKKIAPVPHRALRVKYVVLILLVMMALMGTHLVGWLDPLSLLTRSTAVSLAPAANHGLNQVLKGGAEEDGVTATVLKPAYRLARRHLLTAEQRAFAQSAAIGLILLLILALNLWRRRFYCNTLCPLGALYGLISRFSLMRLKTRNHCKSCNVCAAHCTYGGSPYKDYRKADCLVCFNCAVDCPHDAVATEFTLPVAARKRTPLDLGRRRVLGGVVAGLVAGTLPAVGPRARRKIHGFIRPPGAVKEKEFLEKCVRCGQCMQVCPTNVIQPAVLETGVDGLWTPVLRPDLGYCEYECNRCTQVCPTRALEPLNLKEKKEFKIGTAVIDRNRCYTYADGYNCAVCEEHCPVPEKAIHFREVELWNFEGRLVKVNQIYVVPDLCIGCGICQNVCPRSDAPAIFVSAEEEQREFSYY
ncbi:MAG: 4Fe-4S binding protein [Candidatus Aminicenantes bacterium]|nr:4Fe-4S binding protein [Candidatus Aminicenantes bacterium]